MDIYVVLSGEKYEGESIVSCHSDLTVAKQRADSYNLKDPIPFTIRNSEYALIDCNGVDYVRVVKMKLE